MFNNWKFRRVLAKIHPFGVAFVFRWGALDSQAVSRQMRLLLRAKKPQQLHEKDIKVLSMLYQPIVLPRETSLVAV